MWKRLDLILVEKFQFTRSKAHKLILDGCIYVNGKLILKKHQKFSMNIMIYIMEKATPSITLDYLEVQEDFIIVNKPAGVICHRSNTTPHNVPILNEMVAKDYTLSASIIPEEFGLPHRIDRATEGLVLLSRTDEFYQWAIKAFESGKIKKTYLCVVEMGAQLKDEGIIQLNLYYGKDKVLVRECGVNSITKYKILNRYGNYAVLEVEPLTGRRHQIRVALSHVGSPIVGDSLYGGKTFERLCLFAVRIESERFKGDIYNQKLHDINNLIMYLLFD